jgi:CRISPR-associated protein Csm1
MSEDQLWPLVTAALLHDIGKVILRTELREWHDKAAEYCRASPRHTRFSSCETCKDEYGYLHAMLGGIAARDFLPRGLEPAAHLIEAHHRARGYSKQVKVLMLADWLSAAERADQEETDAPVRHMQSLLRSLGSPTKAPVYFPLSPLTLSRKSGEKTLFPVENPSADTASGYRFLWEGLVERLHRLKQIYPGDPQGYFAGLMAALQVHLWAVPSAYYYDMADISLYEHLRLTAAFAAALWLNGDVTDELLDASISHSSEAAGQISFQLVVGDISGLQSFLYTLTSKAVARSLRGRSFYLDMVTEISARWLLQQLELPLCNLLYSGGGRFYILSYPLDSQRWQELRLRLARTFWDVFEGRLYLALASVPFTAGDLLDQSGQISGYAEVWARRVGPALAEVKGSRFSELGYAAFVPRGGGSDDLCAVCGRYGATQPLEGDDQRRKICDVCSQLAELGRDLADARYIVLRKENNRANGLFPFLGYTLHPTESVPTDTTDVIYVATHQPAEDLKRLMDDLASNRQRPAVAWRFLPKVVARLHEEARSSKGEHPRHVASFQHLANRAKGSLLLGILRMDVDSLGKLFGEGLGSRASPSRLSTLSFLLRLFFEGWVDTICHTLDPEEKYLYLLYAGGDDLFVVGSWHLLPELALSIREDFRSYTGNSNITLSAGLYLAEPKLPLYQTAERAKEALEAAKARTQNGKVVKDAINFLGRTWSWDEFKHLKQEAEKLAKWVEEDKIPRGLLQRLMGFYQQQEADRARVHHQRGRPHYGPWIWQTAYHLARTAELHRELHAELRHWAEQIKTDPARLEVLAYASRWAELLTRKEERREVR